MANSGWIFQFCFFCQVFPALDDLGRGIGANLDLSLLLLAILPFHTAANYQRQIRPRWQNMPLNLTCRGSDSSGTGGGGEPIEWDRA